MPKIIETEAEAIQKAFKKQGSELTDKERDVVKRYYGLENQVRHSLEEIGEIYQVTRERIRQIKVSALMKLGINGKK